jgi:type IV pilus assembly protein PilY1
VDATDPSVKDMSRTAEWGKGQFFHAKNSAQLTDSLLKTMTSLLDQSGSITAPGVAVNQFNRLTHLDQLYYAVFDPDAKKARWRGNVKRYRLKFTDTTLPDGTVEQTATIVDSKGVNAVDPDTSFFISGSWSWWSTSADGNNAVEGGAASQIPAPSARTFYTYLGGKPAAGGASLVTLNSVAAADGRAAMSAASDGQFVNARNWLLGYKLDIIQPATATTQASVKTTAVNPTTTSLLRKELGGVLHSQPVLVNYGYTGTDPTAAAADATKQDNMVFFSTMEGSLHAVNANTGVETFAFMPKELLPHVPALIVNDFTSDTLPKFGLDSTWTVLRVDGDKDLKIASSGAGGDRVNLFGGMRMGGRSYYGLDVTNRSAPKIMWFKYANGEASDSSLAPYTNMGYTWSEPVVADVKINRTVKTVLFFAGGYDPKHETAGYTAANTADAMGNQVYMVDPANGTVLWWASNTGANLNSTDLKFSIPSKIKTFDADKDGLVDALYFGDLGGQVFRIDLDNGNTSSANIGKRIRRIANLGQGTNANTVNQRRFYEPPSVAILYDAVASKEYVAVALGSGYRSHPLNLATEDFFYVLRDDDVLRKDILTTTTLQAEITPSDLATLNLSSAAGATMTDKMGWMIDLPSEGEKVLTSAIILFGEVFFTSYVPDDPESTEPPDPCQPVLGYTKLWRMSVLDGKVVTDFDGDGDMDSNDRLYSNDAGSVVMGLGGAPQVLVGSDGKNAIITGTGVVRNSDLDSANMRRTRWYEKTKR